MGNIIDYTVVRAGASWGQLEDLVKQYLDMGWEPLGGVSVGSDGALYQAMIRKSGEKE